MNADKQESQKNERDPFEKFKSLAKKLVRVPREEYAQEQKKYDAHKRKDTRRGKVKATS